MENWKPIAGYEGIYEVSDLGNVRNIIERKNSYAGKILKPRLRSNGYYQFALTKYGKTRHFKAARLVAQAFIPNPENKPTVNHRDGIKNHDVVSNLEWATISENTQHAYDNGLAFARKGENHNNSRLKELGVIVIKGLLKSGKTAAEIARHFGVHEMTIFDIKWGRTWAWLK